MRSMYHPPSDSVIDSIHEANRLNISKLKKHLRDCIAEIAQLRREVVVERSAVVAESVQLATINSIADILTDTNDSPADIETITAMGSDARQRCRLCSGMPLDPESDWCLLLESGVLQLLKNSHHALVGETKIWFRKNITASYEMVTPPTNIAGAAKEPRWVLRHNDCKNHLENHEYLSKCCNCQGLESMLKKPKQSVKNFIEKYVSGENGIEQGVLNKDFLFDSFEERKKNVPIVQERIANLPRSAVDNMALAFCITKTQDVHDAGDHVRLLSYSGYIDDETDEDSVDNDEDYLEAEARSSDSESGGDSSDDDDSNNGSNHHGTGEYDTEEVDQSGRGEIDYHDSDDPLGTMYEDVVRTVAEPREDAALSAAIRSTDVPVATQSLGKRLAGVPLPLTTRPVEMDPDIAQKYVENASWRQKNDRLKVVLAPLPDACIVAAPNQRATKTSNAIISRNDLDSDSDGDSEDSDSDYIRDTGAAMGDVENDCATSNLVDNSSSSRKRSARSSRGGVVMAPPASKSSRKASSGLISEELNDTILKALTPEAMAKWKGSQLKAKGRVVLVQKQAMVEAQNHGHGQNDRSRVVTLSESSTCQQPDAGISSAATAPSTTQLMMSIAEDVDNPSAVSSDARNPAFLRPPSQRLLDQKCGVSSFGPDSSDTTVHEYELKESFSELAKNIDDYLDQNRKYDSTSSILPSSKNTFLALLSDTLKKGTQKELSEAQKTTGKSHTETQAVSSRLFNKLGNRKYTTVQKQFPGLDSISTARKWSSNVYSSCAIQKQVIKENAILHNRLANRLINDRGVPRDSPLIKAQRDVIVSFDESYLSKKKTIDFNNESSLGGINTWTLADNLRFAEATELNNKVKLLEATTATMYGTFHAIPTQLGVKGAFQVTGYAYNMSTASALYQQWDETNLLLTGAGFVKIADVSDNSTINQCLAETLCDHTNHINQEDALPTDKRRTVAYKDAVYSHIVHWVTDSPHDLKLGASAIGNSHRGIADKKLYLLDADNILQVVYWEDFTVEYDLFRAKNPIIQPYGLPREVLQRMEKANKMKSSLAVTLFDIKTPIFFETNIADQRNEARKQNLPETNALWPHLDHLQSSVGAFKEFGKHMNRFQKVTNSRPPMGNGYTASGQVLRQRLTANNYREPMKHLLECARYLDKGYDAVVARPDLSRQKNYLTCQTHHAIASCCLAFASIAPYYFSLRPHPLVTLDARSISSDISERNFGIMRYHTSVFCMGEIVHAQARANCERLAQKAEYIDKLGEGFQKSSARAYGKRSYNLEFNGNTNPEDNPDLGNDIYMDELTEEDILVDHDDPVYLETHRCLRVKKAHKAHHSNKCVSESKFGLAAMGNKFAITTDTSVRDRFRVSL